MERLRKVSESLRLAKQIIDTFFDSDYAPKMTGEFKEHYLKIEESIKLLEELGV